MTLMVVLMSGGVRYGRRLVSHVGDSGAAVTPGLEGAKFSSEESDLMQDVFKAALKLFSGQATRKELAGELSDKLYAGRSNPGEMSELGIELVKPGGDSPLPEQAGGPAAAGAASQPNATPGVARHRPVVAQPPEATAPAVPAGRVAMLGKVWDRTKGYNVELAFIPVVFMGMVVMSRRRARRTPDDMLTGPNMAMLLPTDSEPFDQKHAVHAMSTEDFEMLVALIYQRQGYRISMPAAQSGGRGGDFTLAKKSERILVQCKRLRLDHKVPVERVREMQEAVTNAGATRGMFVASCGFTWDARQFAKTKGMTLINARTLDEQITAARETPEEDLLAVTPWVAKFMQKVKLTPPTCPTCEAAMEQVKVSESSVWVCSQRPDCKGRRSPRKYQKTMAPPAATANSEDPVGAGQTSG